MDLRKIITVDGKEVKLVAHGATSILYKQEFGKDFFSDLLKLVKSISTNQNDNGELDFNALTYEQLDQLDFQVLYQIVYILAKGGNKEIAPMVEWLSEFDEFPILDVFPVIQEVIGGLLKRTKK